MASLPYHTRDGSPPSRGRHASNLWVTIRRLVVCNETARSVVNSERGKHLTHVFGFRSKPLARILSTGWRQARITADLSHVRVHDLKHTFGRRLREAGVSFKIGRTYWGIVPGELPRIIHQLSCKICLRLATRFVKSKRVGLF